MARPLHWTRWILVQLANSRSQEVDGKGGEESRSGQRRRCTTPTGAESSRGANGPQVPVGPDCFPVGQLCSRFSPIMCLKSALSACDTPAGKGDAGVSQRLWDLGRRPISIRLSLRPLLFPLLLLAAAALASIVRDHSCVASISPQNWINLPETRRRPGATDMNEETTSWERCLPAHTGAFTAASQLESSCSGFL